MDSNNNEKTVPLLGLRMFVSGLLIFFGAMLYMPQSGIVRTLPLLAVLAAVGDAVYKNAKYTAGCAFVFSFCLLCVNGNSMKFSFVFSVLGALFSAAGAYGFRLLRAGAKTKDKELKKQCCIRGVAVLAVCFALYMLVCGNIIGAVCARIENHKYVDYLNESYSDEIVTHHTSFDALQREYKTYVSLSHNGENVGDKDDCYVSKTEDKVTDYYKGLLLEDGKRLLKTTLGEAADMFEITNCGFDFDKGTLVNPEKEYGEYADSAWYVVSLYHIVEDEKAFEKLYDDCAEVLENERFSKIIICGGNANKVLYTATVSKEPDGALSKGEIREFDEKYLESYGVTEKTVLDYWYNR